MASPAVAVFSVWYDPALVMAIMTVDGWKGLTMGTDTLDPQQHRLTGHRRFWVISAVALFLLTMIVIGTLFVRGRNRWAIMRGLPQNCLIQSDPVFPARVRSWIGEANCRRLFDRPVKVLFRYDDWKLIVLPDLSGIEQFDTLREMEIRTACIPKSQLDRLPAPPSVLKLRISNYLTMCSDTCNVEAADTKPWKPEFAWDGKDMAFLSRFHTLRELELRSLWLRTGVLDVVGDLTQLEVLSLKQSDFPSAELPSLGRLRKLRVLTFWNTPKSMRSLEWLRDMESLEELTLVGCRNIDAKMLEPLAQLPRLHTLRLDGGSLTSDAAPALGTFHQLRVLTLSGVDLRGQKLQHLSSLEHLEWLDINYDHLHSVETLQSLLTSLRPECIVYVNHYEHRRYSSLLPPDVLSRLSNEPRKELEFPVDY